MTHADHYRRRGMYYAGRWQQGQGIERIALISPATGGVLGEIPQATSADVSAAVESSCTGLRGMHAVPAWERSALLRKAAALVRERARSIGLLVADETGNPEIIAQDLMADPRVAKISFTGSVPVGKQLIAQAAQTVKRVSMELDGHAPVIVHEDADVDAFIAAAVQAKFRNAGQVCASPTRFYIHRSVLGKVVAGMSERTKLLRVGDPLRDDTEVGPLATQRRRASVAALVEDAVAAGATLNAGGRQPDATTRGFYYLPTILSGVPENARAMQEEPFGPIALISDFESVDDVIERANGLPFGLCAYVFTRSLRHARTTADRLQAGVIGVNTFTASTAETPFGGMKESGFGREGGPFAIRDYLESKFINLSMPS